MNTARRRGRPPKVAQLNEPVEAHTLTAQNEEAAKVEGAAWASPSDATDEIRSAARVLLNARMGAFGDEVRGEKLAPEFQRALERIARR